MKLKWNCSFFRIHVRRSDKVNEAKFYGETEYMEWVDIYFDYYNKKNPDRPIKQRTLYVASDDQNVFNYMEEK